MQPRDQRPIQRDWPPLEHFERTKETVSIDASNLHLNIFKVGSVVIGIIVAVIYARDFQHETKMYQDQMTRSMGELVSELKEVKLTFVSGADLSAFCLMAEKDNPQWRCPAAFQWRQRQGNLTVRVKGSPSASVEAR